MANTHVSLEGENVFENFFYKTLAFALIKLPVNVACDDPCCILISTKARYDLLDHDAGGSISLHRVQMTPFRFEWYQIEELLSLRT